jgi:large subunit ribosomal protein L10
LVKEGKIKAVEAMRKNLDEAAVIGLLDMHKMPSGQLQKIRKELRGKAEIKMVKKSILMFAMEKSEREGLKKLEGLMPSQPTMVFTNMDPFKFYALVSKLRLPAYAKVGDEVEHDVKVSAGPTSLMPGPVISEFQKAGIPATIQEGKIAIRKDKTVLKAGNQVTSDLASIFRKLKIQPVTVGLNVVAMLKDNEIYKKDVLEIVNELPKQIPQASQNALNLSVFICYPTKQNVKILIAKATNEANVINALGHKEEKVEEKPPAEKPAEEESEKAKTKEKEETEKPDEKREEGPEKKEETKEGEE